MDNIIDTCCDGYDKDSGSITMMTGNNYCNNINEAGDSEVDEDDCYQISPSSFCM